MSDADMGMKGEFCKDCPAGGSDAGCTQLTYRPKTVSPGQWIEGYPESPIWIIGLNPKTTENAAQDMNLDEKQLREGFSERVKRTSACKGVPYFQDFAKVSQPLFDALGARGGVAHVDIVKCDSSEWPPKGISSSNIKKIEETCAKYLEIQIKNHKPKLLICNGSSVSTYIKALLKRQDKPNDETETFFESDKYGYQMQVILSGFIGRIDNYSKRRLGKEIEQRIDALKIMLSA
jgi:uracil-DNA glycosylase